MADLEVSKGSAWSQPTTWDAVCRRAAGRRAYNARRTEAALLRRVEVVGLYRRLGRRHGVQAEVARRLGVSQATVSRDLQALRELMAPCPCCGSLVPRERLQGLDDGSVPLGPSLVDLIR